MIARAIVLLSLLFVFNLQAGIGDVKKFGFALDLPPEYKFYDMAMGTTFAGPDRLINVWSFAQPSLAHCIAKYFADLENLKIEQVHTGWLTSEQPRKKVFFMNVEYMATKDSRSPIRMLNYCFETPKGWVHLQMKGEKDRVAYNPSEKESNALILKALSVSQ